MDASDIFPVTIGRCIYCEATEAPREEHVVPYGLEGRWVLREASCEPCRLATEGYDNTMVNTVFGPMRGALGMRSRRKSRRRNSYPLTVRREGEAETIILHTSDHPGAFVLPLLPPPGGEADALLAGTGTYRARLFGRDDKLQRIRVTTNADAVDTPVADAAVVAGFYAKIGYAFAVGVWGMAALRDTFVRDCIRYGHREILRRVWTIDRADLQHDGLHHVYLIVEDEEAFADVHLFARADVPAYRVSLGRLRAEA